MNNQSNSNKSPLSRCISAMVSGLVIYSNVLISNNQSSIIHRLVRPSGRIRDVIKKTYYPQVSLYLKSIFICVFAGCARPDDSAKRIRESLERLLECIIWVIIMNSFVSFNLVWTSSLYYKFYSQYTLDLLAFYRTWMKINILNVNKKTYFEHHEVMFSICLTNHKSHQKYIVPCFLLSIIEL